MLKKDLATALGISAAMISKLARRGMPTDTLERAERWRRRHLEPGRVKGVRYERRPLVDPVEAVHNLAAAALIDFKPYGHALRKALKALPVDRENEVSLPLEVWEDLHLLEALELLMASGKATATIDELAGILDTCWPVGEGGSKV